jgi:hypothetical protein
LLQILPKKENYKNKNKIKSDTGKIFRTMKRRNKSQINLTLKNNKFFFCQVFLVDLILIFKVENIVLTKWKIRENYWEIIIAK